MFASAPTGAATGAEPTLRIDTLAGGIPLGRHMTWYADESGVMTFAEGEAKAEEGAFVSGDTELPNFVFTNAAIWVRIRVKNPSDAPVEWVLEYGTPAVEQLDAYLPLPRGGYRHVAEGFGRVVDRSPWAYPYHTYRITTTERSEAVVYLRVRTGTAMVMLLRAWTPDAFYRFAFEYALLMGGYFALFAGMILYNFFIYLSLRDRIYLHYVIFHVLLLVTEWLFFGFARGWLPSAFAPDYVSVVLALTGFSYAAAVRFSRSFLTLDKIAPRLDRFLLWLQWWAVVVGIASLFTTTLIASGLVNTTLILIMILFGAGVYALRSGVRAARFYVVAWGGFLLTVTLFGVTNANVIETTQFRIHIHCLGTALEALLLSFALADRINIMRNEKEAAEERERRALETTKVGLEITVAERTADLEQAKRVAEEATRLKNTFVALVAHDLRSPLAGVQSYLAQLSDPAWVSQQDRSLLPAMASSAKKTLLDLLGMIDRLLDIHRFSRGIVRLEKGSFAPRVLADSHLHHLMPAATTKGITIINEIDDGVSLYADPNLYGQVIQNLLSNAIKFCSHGGRIRLFDDGPGRIGIEDDGIGIAEEKQQALFSYEARTSTPGTGGEKGYGFGLPFCADIMRAHGGGIEVTSTLKKGSRFTLVLPPGISQK